MNLIESRSAHRHHSILAVVVVALGAAVLAGCGRKGKEASSAGSPEADAHWQRVLESSKSTPMPANWRTNPPKPEEIRAFRESHGDRILQSADVARDFYNRFPNHTNVEDAMQREYALLQTAANLGKTSAIPRLNDIEAGLLKDPLLPATDRFQLRLQQVQRNALAARAQGDAAVLDALETGARALQKDFPAEGEVYSLLVQVAQVSDSAKARSIADEVLGATAAPATAKEQAGALRKKLGREGQPLNLKFTAIDGREIDTARLRGKVLLIDFWATWCGPCVAELPNVKAVYARFKDRGFEIIGISLDNSREQLDAFLRKEQIAWPQHFDGKGWENEISRGFEITSVPTMWLVDKKGVIRDVFARHNLAEKTGKLLAE